MATPFGAATDRVLHRQPDLFGDARFLRLGSVWVAHRYNWRNNACCRNERVIVTQTRPTKAVHIGVHKAPKPDRRPGFIGIDSGHQGELDGSTNPYPFGAWLLSPAGIPRRARMTPVSTAPWHC